MTDLMPEPVTDLDALADRTPSPTTTSGPDVLDAVDEQLLDRLVGQAREGGLQLTGEGGLLAQLTKRGWSNPPWRASCPTTSAMASTTRRAATAGTPATAIAARRC